MIDDPPRRTGLPILLVGGAAAVTAVVVAVIVMQASPSGGVSPETQSSAEPAPSVTTASSQTEAPSTPSASSSATPITPTTDLAWSETGSFASEGGPSIVEHLVSVDGGYVAAGIAYGQPLPNVGPTPRHALQIWHSPDGRAWEAVSLPPEFENVQFTSLVERPDGSLLATGNRSAIGEQGSVETSDPAAWTSQDGQTWSEAESGLPGTPTKIVAGGRGYLALIRPSPGEEGWELWLSADAATWELVHALEASRIDVGAGAEGFVAAGRSAGEAGEPFAIASADGREWLTASSPPPTFVPLIGSLAGDWIAMSAFGEDEPMPNGGTWASANGLEWAPHGQAPMERVQGGGVECHEYPRNLESAGPWLVASADLSYPCSEGGFAVHGSQLISIDGATWEVVPFDVGTVGEARSGSSVSTAYPAEESLILAGEKDGVATFWIGEAQ